MLNILTILLDIYVFKDIIFTKYMLSILVFSSSTVIAIFARNNEFELAKNLRNRKLITDEGERRLQPEEKYIINQNIEEENSDKEKEDVRFDSKEEEFIDILCKNKDLVKTLSFYEDTDLLDCILKDIYDIISIDEYIDILKYKKMLAKYNIIIDINDKDIIEEVRVLEKASIRIIKDIKRKKDEAEIKEELAKIQSTIEAAKSEEQIDVDNIYNKMMDKK